MYTTYHWLYDNFAEDLQKEFMKYEEKAVNRLSHDISLTDHQRIQLVDCLADIRFHSGVESFALGIQFGLRLTMDFWRELPDSTAS